MKNSRNLWLRREVLTELSTTELDRVVGGTHLCTILCNFTGPCTHVGPSIDACPTLPLDQCVAVKATFTCL